MLKKLILILCFLILSITGLAQDNDFNDVEMEYDALSFNWIVNGQVGWPAGNKPVFNVEDAAHKLYPAMIMLKYGAQFPDLKNYINKMSQKGNFLIELKGIRYSEIPDANKITGTISYWKKVEEDEDEVPIPPDDGSNDQGWEDPSPKNTEEDFEKPILDEEPEPSQEEEDMSGYANKGKSDEIPAEMLILDSEKDIFGLVKRLIIITNMNFPEWNQIGLNYEKDVLELHVGM